jgi:hypothetical protein
MRVHHSVLIMIAVLVAAIGVRGDQIIVTSGDEPVFENRELPPGTGLIMGRVVEGESNQPVSEVIVALSSSTSNAGPDPVLTDSQGRFVLRELPKGSYRLSASKTGYAYGSYAQRLPYEEPGRSGRTLTLEDDQRLGDVVLRIWQHASITGAVIDEAGEPMVGVAVRASLRRLVAGRFRFDWDASATGGSSPLARTDDRGLFRLTGLIPGEYLVAVPSLTGAIPRVRQPAPSPAGPTSLTESSTGGGQWITGSGTVRSNPVEVGDADYLLTSATFAQSPIAGVSKTGQLLIYPTQFYSGAHALRTATLVALRSGERRESVNFQMRPVPAARVSGTVVADDGMPPGELMLRLVSREMDAFVSDAEIAQTISQADGRFTFLGVPPGEYAIRLVRIPRDATPLNLSTMTTVAGGRGAGTIISTGGRLRSIPEEPTFLADTPVSVGDQGAAGVVVRLRTGPRIRGRVQFDGTAPPPRLENLSAYIDRADGSDQSAVSQLLGRIDAKGLFGTYGQQPGKYYVRMPYASVPGWHFHGATLGGRDLSLTPVDLTQDVEGVVLLFRDRPLAALSGTVTDERGQPATAVSIVLFPADRERWVETGRWPRDLRATGAGINGHYAVENLPDGDYFVTAVADAGPAWAEPSFLSALAATATPVTLRNGESRTTDLREQRVAIPGAR